MKVSSVYTNYRKELLSKDMQNIDLPRYFTELWFLFLRDPQVFLPECAIWRCQAGVGLRRIALALRNGLLCVVFWGPLPRLEYENELLFGLLAGVSCQLIVAGPENRLTVSCWNGMGWEGRSVSVSVSVSVSSGVFGKRFHFHLISDS